MYEASEDHVREALKTTGFDLVTISSAFNKTVQEAENVLGQGVAISASILTTFSKLK